MKQYYEEISIARGIAILMVILGHSVITYPIDLGEVFWCEKLLIYINSFHMPLFFFISGFLLANGKTNYGKQFFLERFKRIAVPYLLISVIDILPRILIPSAVNRKTEGVLDTVSNILLFGGNYWFLYTLFLILILFPLIKYFLDRGKFACVGFAILVIINGIMFYNYCDIFTFKKVLHFMFYIAVGYSINKIYSEKVKCVLNNKYSLIVLSVLFLSICGIKELRSYYMFALLLPLVGTFLVITISLKINNNKVKYLLNLAGAYSLQLYLLNGYFLVASRIALINILHIQNSVILVTLNFIVSVVGGMIVTHFVIKRFKITKIIFGFK